VTSCAWTRSPPHDPGDDLLAFLFDAGTLTSDQTATLSLGDSELAEYRCCTPPTSSPLPAALRMAARASVVKYLLIVSVQQPMVLNV
jgi:hypothetical protein